jgi:hypothetical protein
MIFLKTKKDKKKHPEDEAICGNANESEAWDTVGSL